MNRALCILFAFVFFSLLTDTAAARLMRSWSKQELLDKSDLVVIAVPVSSTDTKEPVSLPGTPHALATGVKTKFTVSQILKGPEDLKEFTLHHARPADPPGITINGPSLVSFDGAKKQSFLLYLVREEDGSYAPVSGQTDPSFQAIVPAGPAPSTAAGTPQPTPGPANGGLRMRLTIAPDLISKVTACQMQIDLINVSEKPVTLRADWRHDEETGDLKDYVEAAAGIETMPAIASWLGQVMEGRRSKPQPEAVLKTGESLTVKWKTDGRRLKNRVSNPLTVQNPEFPVPGLYSIHAALAIPTDAGTVLLRSNEQLFSAGGGDVLPKSTYGQLISVSSDPKSAVINLGSLQKVQQGDVFRIRTGYFEFYRLTITATEPSWAAGTLAPEPPPDPKRTVPFPVVGQYAEFTKP
ncbi:MAG TPA: hypothetical protein VG796_02060 [Verrucomicrobiales bacterium]|nr:hypothetical protein [Verrucomicrobiales bacterium]